MGTVPCPKQVLDSPKPNPVYSIYNEELILLRIAVFAPVLSRHTIVKNSTSLNSIWDSLCLYYGLDNLSEPNILLAQSSHQQSCKLYSGPSQIAPAPQETSQAQQDTIEHSENAPTSFTVHLSQSVPVHECIDQLRSPNLVRETSSTVVPSPQPNEEYIDPPAGNSTTATKTFTESCADLCRQEMDDLPVHREEYSSVSSCLVFDSSELDLYLHPVKFSSQVDYHLDLFPESHNTTHSHQQPEIAPFLLSSSHNNLFVPTPVQPWEPIVQTQLGSLILILLSMCSLTLHTLMMKQMN